MSTTAVTGNSLTVLSDVNKETHQSRQSFNHQTICILGTQPEVGRKTFSINLALELAKKYKIIYSESDKKELNPHLIESDSLKQFKKSFENSVFLPTVYPNMKYLAFSSGADKLSPQKLEEMIVSLPEKIKQENDFFVFSVSNPFEFPDRYVLLNSDIYIILSKIESTTFSDIFQQLEKLSFLPNPPKEIFLVFNYVKDLQLAFDTYEKILEHASDFNIKIQFYFLGTLPYDSLRQEIAKKANQPFIKIFPGSPFEGAISFITDKILKFVQIKKK